MKTGRRSTAKKLIERFDNQLKSLLLNDLKAVKLKIQANFKAA